MRSKLILAGTLATMISSLAIAEDKNSFANRASLDLCLQPSKTPLY